jgi:hypothetical protein
MGERKRKKITTKKIVPGELSSLNKCETRPKKMAHLAKAVPKTLRGENDFTSTMRKDYQLETKKIIKIC